jgi:choline dehydrogenase-like flavoprotein
MIDARPTLDALRGFGAQICVIGAGPVGIVTALALERHDFRVLLLESGRHRVEAAAQALSEAERYDEATHHEPSTTVARRLGGASNLWGGRCLPYDPVDFAPRPWLALPPWPIGPEDLAPYAEAACAYLAAGAAVWRAPLPGVAADEAFDVAALERWSNVPRLQVLHRAALATSAGLHVALGATALGFDYDDAGRIAAVELHLEGRAGGACPCPPSCSPPAATRAPGSCSPSSAATATSSAAATGPLGAPTWGT